MSEEKKKCNSNKKKHHHHCKMKIVSTLLKVYSVELTEPKMR